MQRFKQRLPRFELISTLLVLSVMPYLGSASDTVKTTKTKPANVKATGKRTMINLNLNGTWKVRSQPLTLIGLDGLSQINQAKEGWIDAQVPGEIHLDLMKAGQMTEPSFEINMPKCRWPEAKSWWYRTTFKANEDFLKLERQQLIFDGLDLYALVFVNGKLVGEAQDAFVPAVFDVKKQLKAGENELVVRLTAGDELAKDDTPPGQGQTYHVPTFGEIPNQAKEGDPFTHRNWYGRKWLRKAQFTYGWDWVDSLPNIGIWRGVRLEGRTYATLEEIRLDTVLKGKKAFLEMASVIENLHPWSERACILTLSITAPNGEQVVSKQYPINATPGQIPINDLIEIPHPQLWWPNGMGEQPLYRVVARVLTPDGVIQDQKQFSIGLRTVDIDRTHLKEGSRFCVRVNGQDVFCRGGNLGPHDAILARITDAKYESLVSEAKNANMNMFRINGVSIFEGQAFYDACDRAGILIMHDFPFSCATYPDFDPAFCQQVRNETESALKLLRHHPSIALWSGGNECIWGLCDWYNGDRSKPFDLGGSKIYNEILPEVCRLVDPHRPYWPSSPCGGENPGSELSGDCHWWNAYLSRDANVRIDHKVFDTSRARFVSEWGFPAPCHIDSIKEYLSPEQMKVGSPAWNWHENQLVWDTIDTGIRRFYSDPKGLPLQDYVTYGQMVQADVHGHAMEAFRFRKHDPVDDCEGALIWAYSDCWGESGWSVLDYYLRRKAGYYAIRRACAPVKVIVRKRGEKLVTRLVNDTMQRVTTRVEYGWWRLDGKTKETRTSTVTLGVNSMKEIGTSALSGHDPHDWVYAAIQLDAAGVMTDSSIWMLDFYRALNVPQPDLKLTKLEDGWIEISSPVYAHGVHVEDGGHELVSDNWFDLLPNRPVRVRLQKGTSMASLKWTCVEKKPID